MFNVTESTECVTSLLLYSQESCSEAGQDNEGVYFQILFLLTFVLRGIIPQSYPTFLFRPAFLFTFVNILRGRQNNRRYLFSS